MPKVGKIKSERLPISHSSRYDGTSIAVATVKIFSLSICFSARSSKSPYLSRWAWASMSMVTPRQREICLNCKAADRHRRFGLAVVIAESKKTDDGRGQIHEHEALFGQIEQHAEGERADADAEIVKTLILRHRLAAFLGCGRIHRERHQRRLRGADAGAADHRRRPEPHRRSREGEQEKAAHVHDQTGNDHGAPADAVGQRASDRPAQEQRKRIEAEPEAGVAESQMDRVDR